MREKSFLIVLIGSLILSFALSASEQVVKKTFQMSGDVYGGEEVFVINEFGGTVSESEEGLQIDMVMPPSARSAAYKGLDVQAGDIIKMVNGKKFTKSADLEKFYDELEVGSEIMMGIVRGKNMMINRFVKAHPDSLPGQVVVHTITDTDDGAHGDYTALIDLGIILSENDNDVQISQTIDELKEIKGDITPKMLDYIRMLQGKKVTSMKEVSELYKEVKVGETLKMVIERDGKEYTISVVKPKVDGDFKVMKVTR